MIDRVRYFLGVLNVIVIPPGLLFWLLIHPWARGWRRLGPGIAVVANALIINSVGMYVLILLVFPAGFVMLMFEERDLVDRFGEEYRQYQREVPLIVPRLRKAKRE